MQENEKGIERRQSNIVFGWVAVVVVDTIFSATTENGCSLRFFNLDNSSLRSVHILSSIVNSFLKNLSSLSGCLPFVEPSFFSVCDTRIRFLIYLKNSKKFNPSSIILNFG